MSEKRMKKPVLVAGGIIIVLLCTGLIALFVGGNSSTKRVAELLDLGNKYLEEHDYEQAALAFQEAIEIDPKCGEAYHGLADVYISVEDYEAACEILRQGIVQTGAEELSVYLDEIEGIYARLQEEAEAEARAQEEAAIRKREEKERERQEKEDKETETQEEEDTETQQGTGAKTQEETDSDTAKAQEESPQEVASEDVKEAGDSTGEKIAYENGDYEVTEYDASGNKVKWTYYEADGTLNRWETYEYEYGNDGSYVQIVYQYAYDGALYYITKFEYDASGNYVKGSQYLPDGTLYYEYHP